VLNKSLTIVLPVYNGETRLRRSVNEILELASELTTKFGVLIIDDGSTDSTYEVAEELAAHFPQVSVRRHRHRRGLSHAIDYAQRRLRSDAVMIHDGVTPIDPFQMRSAWQSWIAQGAKQVHNSDASSTVPSDICDLSNLPAIHAAMEEAHRRVIGFQIITPKENVADQDDLLTLPRHDRASGPYRMAGAGIGRIPTMPRPKFLSALTNFALGE
jgi:glycosyltransferase involved in cell wall biosynthesis